MCARAQSAALMDMPCDPAFEHLTRKELIAKLPEENPLRADPTSTLRSKEVHPGP